MTTANGFTPEFRRAVARELEDLSEDILWTEKVHFAHAEAHARINLWLGLTSTISASIAAATVLTEAAPVVTGAAALIAAITAGLLTFLKPQEAELRHLTAGRQLNALRVRARQMIRIDLATSAPDDPRSWRALPAEVASEKAKIDGEAPALSGRAFDRARTKIEAGHFEHESDSTQRS